MYNQLKNNHMFKFSGFTFSAENLRRDSEDICVKKTGNTFISSSFLFCLIPTAIVWASSYLIS